MANLYDPTNNLLQANSGLAQVLRRALITMPFDLRVLCTYRSDADQQKAFDTHHSKARPGESAHNFNPSLAIDVAPFPIDWNDLERFDVMARCMKDAAAKAGVAITWGGDWPHFKDYPHFELTHWREIVAAKSKQGE